MATHRPNAFFGKMAWVLTKRPENISSMIAENWFVKEPDNVRIGVTAEDQMNGNRRIPRTSLPHGMGKISFPMNRQLGRLTQNHSCNTHRSLITTSLHGDCLNGMVLIGSSVVVKAEPDAERWIFNGRG